MSNVYEIKTITRNKNMNCFPRLFLSFSKASDKFNLTAKRCVKVLTFLQGDFNCTKIYAGRFEKFSTVKIN